MAGVRAAGQASVTSPPAPRQERIRSRPAGVRRRPRRGPSARCRWPRRSPARPRAWAGRAGEEPGRGDLALRRTPGRVRRTPPAERRERDLGLAQQQPADDQVAERRAAAGWCSARPCRRSGSTSSARVRAHQRADHDADDALHVLQRRARAARARASAGRCRRRPWRGPAIWVELVRARPLSRTILRKKRSRPWIAVVPS